jgi:putative PEP-CTERM system TPR-repeat lipoprotein
MTGETAESSGLNRMIAQWRVAALGIITALAVVAGIDDAAARSADEYINSAEEYRKDGRPRASAIELKNAIQQDPKNPIARLLLGQIYLELGDVLRAEKELSRARDLGAPFGEWAPSMGRVLLLAGRFETLIEELDPGQAEDDAAAGDVLVLHGNAHMALNALDESEKSFQAALERTPGSAGALVGLSRLAMARNDRAAAEKWHTEALQAAPDDIEVLALSGDYHVAVREFATAEKAYERVVALRPQNLFVRIPLAQTMLANGKTDEAIVMIDGILAALPQNPRALYLRAAAAYAKQDYETALEKADMVLLGDPREASARLLAGAASYALGRNERAARYAAAVLSDHPNSVLARRLHGATLLRLGRAAEAMEVLEPLEGSEQTDVLAVIATAAVQNRDLAKGKEYFERYAKLNPESAVALTQLGVVKLNLGEFEEGIQDLERALELDPSFDRAAVALFTNHVREGRTEEALKLARSLAEQNPERPLGIAMEGVALLAADDRPAARSAFERALEIDPGSISVLTNLARLDVTEDNPDAARAHLLDALEATPDHLGTLVNLARLEAFIKDDAAMLAWIDRAEKAHPAALEPRYMHAQYLFQKNKPHQAVAVAQEVAARSPDDPAVLRLLGETQIAAGQANSAIKTYRQLVRVSPDDLEVRYRLAVAYKMADDLGSHEDTLNAVLLKEPTHQRAVTDLARLKLDAGDFDGSVALAQSGLETYPDDPALTEVAARAHQALGRSAEAIALFRSLMARLPSSAEAHFLLGRALGQSGELQEGLSYINKTLELDASHHGARLIRARALLAQSDRAGARADLDLLLAALPDNAEVLDLQGVMLLADGSPAEAASAYERALVTAPSPTRVIQLARARWLAGDQDNAIISLRSWLNDHPTDIGPRESLAEYLLARSEYQAARDEYASLIEYNQDNWAMRNNYAWVLWKLGQVDAALEQAEAADKIQPGDPRILDTLGAILLDSGSPERALTVLRDAAKAAPKHPTIQYHFAQALAQTGASDEARQILQTVLNETVSFDERDDAEALLEKLSQ